MLAAGTRNLTAQDTNRSCSKIGGSQFKVIFNNSHLGMQSSGFLGGVIAIGKEEFLEKPMSNLGKRKQNSDMDLDAIRISQKLFGNKSLLCNGDREWGGRRTSHCRVHSRDFSDCFRYHMKQPMIWDNIPLGFHSKPARVAAAIMREHTEEGSGSFCSFESVKQKLTVEKLKCTTVSEKKAIGELEPVKTPIFFGESQSERAVVPSVASRAWNFFILRQICEDETLACSNEQGNKKDPLKLLGEDIMPLILSLLDAGSLARCGILSKDWKSVAHGDALWASKCTSIWSGKRHIPEAALESAISKIAAYGISVKDSRRKKITQEDLCQHVWEFRFKNIVPEYWLNLDPSRRGESPMKRFFHADGSQTAGPDDPVWGGHESTYSIIDDISVDGQGYETFVRINHWPKMVVSRSEDWGWELSNEIYMYQSLPDSYLGGTGPL